MSIIFNIDLVLVILANSVIELPNLRKDFEEFYSADKYRFYERAKRSPHYNSHNMSGKPLESEVAMRRVFGILLCAEEDESVRKFVYGKLMNTDNRFRELVNRPKKAAINAFLADMMNSSGSVSDMINAPVSILTYLLYSKYGLDSDNGTVNDFLSKSYELHLNLHNRAAKSKGIPQIPIPDDVVTIPKKAQKLIRRFKTGLDLAIFHDLYDAQVLETDVAPIDSELYGYITSYGDLGHTETSDIRNAAAVALTATFISNMNEVALNGLYGTAGVTKDEQDAFINMMATLNAFFSSDGIYREITVTHYITGHIFMLLMKEIRNMREVYFRNNDETQYLELQRLENVIADKDRAIEYLETELAKANDQIGQQREEIKRLTDEAYKDNKDAIKPYASEIAGLNSRIRELEKALEAEQAKIPELNALREFAFTAQSEYMPPETTVTLEELIRGKKIIVLGGHVNWRNRMQAQYPAITFLDGHNKTLDISIFAKADFVFLHTANMSHNVYDKVIACMRGRNLKFDYLGRSKNQELLETEIVSILREKM